MSASLRLDACQHLFYAPSFKVTIDGCDAWHEAVEMTLWALIKQAVSELESGIGQLRSCLSTFSPDSSQEAAEDVGRQEQALQSIADKAEAVLKRSKYVADGAGKELATLVHERLKCLHESKMRQVGWGLTELCNRPKAGHIATGKKVRAGILQLYKALELELSIDFGEDGILLETSRLLKIDCPKLPMLKGVPPGGLQTRMLEMLSGSPLDTEANVQSKRVRPTRGAGEDDEATTARDEGGLPHKRNRTSE
jgi:hypothetical protein